MTHEEVKRKLTECYRNGNVAGHLIAFALDANIELSESRDPEKAKDLERRLRENMLNLNEFLLNNKTSSCISEKAKFSALDTLDRAYKRLDAKDWHGVEYELDHIETSF